MSDCCEKPVETVSIKASCCDDPVESTVETKKHHDYILITSSTIIIISYLYSYLDPGLITALTTFTVGIHDIVNTMFWGVAIGVVFIGLLSHVPREFVIAVLGRNGGITGIFRATLAGVFLDLCNHGILMVGAKLYERGATTGQVMAFLIASPWNSISLTLILWAMIGFGWMLCFLVLSMVIAIITGIMFECLVKSERLPDNPNRIELPEEYRLLDASLKGIKQTRYDLDYFKSTFMNGLKDSRMVLRWIFFGIVLAAFIRTIMDDTLFQNWFGPTLLGLSLTLLAATIIEVCSEGTVPVAADLLTRAAAPGNSFTFLMAGVSTDYTEIMVMKEATKSWKISLYLPLLTLPQILVMGLIMNSMAS